MTSFSGGIHKSPLARLVPSPFGARGVRTDARIAEVAQSLATDGQPEPIADLQSQGGNVCEGRQSILAGANDGAWEPAA
jgi:hypothetical protein